MLLVATHDTKQNSILLAFCYFFCAKLVSQICNLVFALHFGLDLRDGKKQRRKERWKRNSDKHCLPACRSLYTATKWISFKIISSIIPFITYLRNCKNFSLSFAFALFSSPWHTESESLSLFRTFLLSFLEGSGSHRASRSVVVSLSN